VAELYRNCDIGFAFMLNKHTTYQMMEYSASGMATVMNENEDTTGCIKMALIVYWLSLRLHLWLKK